MPLEPIWVAFVTVLLVGCLILGVRPSGGGATESGPPVLVLSTPANRQPDPRPAGTRSAGTFLVRSDDLSRWFSRLR